MGERHGEQAYDQCPVCNGKGVIPIYKYENNKMSLCDARVKEIG